MAFVAQKDVKQKIALTLLLLNERFKLANSIVKTASIHISKTDLSSMIGSSLETVIRALKKFSDESLISMKGKNMVIKNEKELIRLAGLESSWHYL